MGKYPERRKNMSLVSQWYHYIFECSFPNVIDIRKKHIPSYYTRYPNVQKMIGLLSLCNVPVL